MATTTDRGNQRVTWDYYKPLVSEDLNRILHTLIPFGISNGGSLSNPVGNDIEISPMVGYLQTDVDKTVRYETTSPVTVTVSGNANDTLIVYAVFNWIENQTNHFVDFDFRKESDPVVGGELQLARVVLNGSGNVSSVENIQYDLSLIGRTEIQTIATDTSIQFAIALGG